MDDELGPDEKKAFIAHIQECRACKEELEEIEHVSRDLRLEQKDSKRLSALPRGSWPALRK